MSIRNASEFRRLVSGNEAVWTDASRVLLGLVFVGIVTTAIARIDAASRGRWRHLNNGSI